MCNSLSSQLHKYYIAENFILYFIIFFISDLSYYCYNNNYAYKKMTSSLQILRELFNVAQVHPQKVAVALDDQVWTYSELVEMVECVANHLHSLNVVQGQIIYQFVERGFPMICGLLGIMCIGGVYCPINPTEPYDRIAALLEQIQGQYAVLHEKTRNQFPSAAVRHIISLDTILVPCSHGEDIYNLPLCNECGPAYIICTSGTTGRPKAIVHTHQSFSASNYAYAKWDVGMYTMHDQVLQVVTCSWNLHLAEVALPLILGGTLVLLRPGGNLDMAYFSRTLVYQQVTTLLISPALIRALTSYIEMSQQLDTFKSVRSLCATGNYGCFIYSGNSIFFDFFKFNLGEAVKPRQWLRFTDLLSSSNVRVSVLYGMSECHGVLGCHLVDINNAVVPIGYPFPNVDCLLINEQNQVINHSDNSNEIGQIHISGKKHRIKSLL
jgi:acyl-coenzyme A synthetase/AMP-(fatty) acid ligase